MEDGKVTQLTFMKVLPTVINRIVFKETGMGRGMFELWRNGHLEMEFSGSK